MTTSTPATTEEAGGTKPDWDDITWLLGDGVTCIDGNGGATSFMGFGRTKAWEYIASGELFAIKRAGRTLVPRREQVRFLRYGPRTEPLVIEE